MSSGVTGFIGFEREIDKAQIDISANKIFSLCKFFLADVRHTHRFGHCPYLSHAGIRREDGETF